MMLADNELTRDHIIPFSRSITKKQLYCFYLIKTMAHISRNSRASRSHSPHRQPWNSRSPFSLSPFPLQIKSEPIYEPSGYPMSLIEEYLKGEDDIKPDVKIESVESDNIDRNDHDSCSTVTVRSADNSRGAAEALRDNRVYKTYYPLDLGNKETNVYATYRQFLTIFPFLVSDMLELVKCWREIVERYQAIYKTDGQASIRDSDVLAIKVEVDTFIEIYREDINIEDVQDSGTTLLHSIRFWFSHTLPSLLRLIASPTDSWWRPGSKFKQHCLLQDLSDNRGDRSAISRITAIFNLVRQIAKRLRQFMYFQLDPDNGLAFAIPPELQVSGFPEKIFLPSGSWTATVQSSFCEGDYGGSEKREQVSVS